MTNLQWYDWVRLCIVVASIASMYRLSTNIRHSETMYSDRMKDYIFVIFVFLFMQFTGSLESIVRDLPFRYSLVLSVVVSVVAFRATRKSDTPLIT